MLATLVGAAVALPLEASDSIGSQLATAVQTQFQDNLPAIVTVVGLFIGVGVVIKMVRKNAKP
ncbi:MAG: hypothetical protein QM779_04870 [Propionicimonas sp.]|uniref:hypothetical protein n=1 Tax=Propionicimonas sp. TaxID=1955623 RepID=UPI003D1388DB